MELNTVNVKHAQFAVHKLNDLGFEKAAIIRDSFDCLLNVLDQVCVEGREFSIAKTKLEEACFFAKKAMAINLNNQDYG